MKIFGIFRLSFLWFTKAKTTVKFAMIPTEAIVLESIIIMSNSAGCSSSLNDVKLFVTLTFVPLKSFIVQTGPMLFDVLPYRVTIITMKMYAAVMN